MRSRTGEGQRSFQIMKKGKNQKIKLGISVGDLNGIGLEVILKTLEDNRINELCSPIIYASKACVLNGLKKFGIQNFNFDSISSIEDAKAKNTQVISIWKEEPELRYGEEDKELGSFAALSLDAAVKDLKAGNIDALVTAPINKNTIQSEEFQYPGHTEYLQAADEAEDSLMLLMSSKARIGVVTGHIPLKEVSNQLTEDKILKKTSLLNKSLKEDFGIRKPKIALLSLNPHAGEEGLLGDEEKKVIEPAINQAKSIGILAFGPYPADGFFGSDNFKNFDGVLAMYHDQGLIAAKYLSFGSGVNFTAGLSFVRTSPDHGTAYGIAGKGEADESSFRNALYEAISISKNRLLQAELEEDVLPVNKTRS